MVDFTATWKQLLTDLERTRDELRVKAQLGKKEARDLLSAAETKLFELRRHVGETAERTKDRAKTAAKAGEERMRQLATEARDLLAKVQDAI
jgi:hypothetical protein